eukprot:1674035-Rhodomonas_salina.1
MSGRCITAHAECGRRKEHTMGGSTSTRWPARARKNVSMEDRATLKGTWSTRGKWRSPGREKRQRSREPA